MAYVSSDGNYGSDDALMFDYSDLTPQQWSNLGEVSDSDRYEYVFLIMNNEADEVIRDFEDSYDLPNTV